jgi:hypothetical protein
MNSSSPAPFNFRDLLWLAAVIVAAVGWWHSYQRAESLEIRMIQQRKSYPRESTAWEREIGERIKEESFRIMERKLAETREKAEGKATRSDDLDDLFGDQARK